MKREILAIGALACASIAAQGQEKERVNVIYILADDLGIGDVSCYNPESKIHTPNLDQMARSGIRFTDCHTSSSVSTPTRYSILTGRYNWRSPLQSGVTWSFSEPLIERERLTVAGMLSQAGYNTAVIGKWHLGLGWERSSPKENDVIYSGGGVNFSPNDNGFDYSLVMPASLDIPPYVYIKNGRFTAPVNDTIKGQGGLGFYREGAIAEDFDINTALEHFTQEALGYIEQQATSEKPFFLYFPLTAPHTPILPPIEFQGKSGLSAYGDFVMYVDDIVGRIVAQVDRLGLGDNTMIVFTSDNGCSPAADMKYMEERGHRPSGVYRGAKADIFEGGHRVPFVVRWRGVTPAGITCDEPATLVSLMATMAEINGISLPANAGEDSFSMVSALRGGILESHPIVHHSHDGYFALRVGDWKLSACPHSGGWSAPSLKNSEGLPAMQLYNFREGVGELGGENIIEKHPERARDMYETLDAIVKRGSSREGAESRNDTEVVIRKNLQQ